MDVQPLQDAFSRLSLDKDKHQAASYYDISEVEEETGNTWASHIIIFSVRPNAHISQSLFELYRQYPANSFEIPIYYRAIHCESPSEVQGGHRARLFPPFK
ncbi:uncharacterized protein BKA55DRAFT_581537 [Fusarium redolens]|uniref:Uncharacterized protein n=1 Tax=Fusarium redolens TaxID=48865 RepID=A0A9P9G5N9_FUSRE|nr:uncharacterized protein BKA55DRAFT_581537 [Fusarium redolens]KAH7231712.1 hypothetical protein BKA55DRAFT_581537 [Fusarium redolens]